MGPETASLLKVLALSAGFAGFVIYVHVLWQRRNLSLAGQNGGGDASAQVVFLFDNEVLIDATTQAKSILGRAPSQLNDWQKMSLELSKRFAGLSDQLSLLNKTPTIAIQETAGPASLIARKTGHRTRISILEASANRPHAGVDHGLILGASDQTTLRVAAESAPYPVWKEGAGGSVTWANKAYLDLHRSASGDDPSLSWPLPTLFPESIREPVQEADTCRVKLDFLGNDPQWFECTTRPCGQGSVVFAFPIDATVRAEALLTSFVQTMTKTFADLPAGLAIFNRERKLTLFNPALTDLLQLDPGYLAARPRLMEFFDHLREKRMMPEPKNYKSWRDQLTQLDEQAQQGKFRETWTLENGQTYRVTGRPHADGALAFLIEDISGEVTLTRRFRQELDQGQAVLDGLEQAIAVFSPAGVLTQSNSAYSALWGTDPSTSLEDVTVHDTTQHWQSRCQPSPVWGEIRDFVTAIEDRACWQDEVCMTDGRTLECQCIPIAGGATMLSFTLPPGAKVPLGQDVGNHVAMI